MTSLLGATKRAEEFAAATEGRSAATATLHPELAELVGVVTVLREQPAPQPRPEFTASLRERLLAEAATLSVEDAPLTLPPRRKGTRERRLAVAASAFVFIGGTAGMAAAAQNALPGDALYPIKRGLERAQTDLSTSESAKGQDLLTAADHRLQEVRGLIDGSSDPDQIPTVVADFTSQASEGSDLLLTTFDQERDPALVEEVRTFAADSLAVLQELAKTAPAAYQDDLAAAATTLLEIDKRAAALCGTCAEDLPSLEMPDLFLAAAEATRALEAAGRARTNNDHPALPGTGAGKPAAGKGETQPAQEAPEEPPVDEAVDGPQGEDVPDVKRDIDAGTGGVLGKTGDTVDELLPEELDPILDALLP